ncbi:MAG: helix-turn-helix domain-containing protein, partial [Bacteroidia bacterium]|nr:helix-turn-helix domain-containing protein [Bacteroidia bacterium]
REETRREPGRETEQWFTVSEAGRILKISQQSVRNRVKDGSLASKKIGNLIRVSL